VGLEAGVLRPRDARQGQRNAAREHQNCVPTSHRRALLAEFLLIEKIGREGGGG